MRPEDQHRVRKNWTHLEENLEAEEVTQHCFQEGILNICDRERIMGEKSRPDKALKLLRILMCKDDDKVYGIFLKVLRAVGQSTLSQRLQDTPVPDDVLQQGADQDGILEGVLRDCLVEHKGKECFVQDLFAMLHLQLKRRQHYVQFRSADVFSLLRTVFPFTKLRKNKRKNVVAVENCCIKPEFLQSAESSHDDEEESAPPAVAVERVACSEVVRVLRHQLETEEGDVSLADRLADEDIDGKALVLLTEQHLKQLFPDLKMGQRIRLMASIKATIAELQKPPELSVQERRPRSPRKLETFRQFDRRVKATDVYEKGHILPDEQSRPGYLLQPVHKYMAAGSTQHCTLAELVVQFSAACMNERVNGTIHFGVAGKYDAEPSCRAGEIVGIQVDKQQCEVAITEEIYRAFFEDQREMALQCIRDPVYIPVVGEGLASAQLFVVEVDVVPHSTSVLKEAFFLNCSRNTKDKSPVLFRYIDGAPTRVTDKELMEFMEVKERQTKLREDCEKDTRTQPAPKPDLHRKLHDLLTDGNDYEVTDIFPVLFLSPPADKSAEYLKENFSSIKSLEPFCVFDFDSPASGVTEESSDCLYNVLENQLGQVYETLTTDNFDKDSQENRTSEHKDAVGKLLESLAGSSFRPWIFCNGYGPLEKEQLKPAAWRSQRGQGFKEAVRFYREQIPSDKARILVFLLSRQYDVLLGALEEIFVKFPDQWILIAESEKIAQELLAEVVRRSYVEKEVLEERCVIGMPWSHVNQSFLKICGQNSSTGCTLPSSTGSPCLLRERDRNGLPDLEILSITQCSDQEFVKRGDIEEMEKKKRISEEDFYRGKQVSWWNFFFRDHVLRRSQFDSFLQRVREKLNGEIPDDEKVAVVTLFHQPGAGGTTTARQLLWELREEFRCCVIKQISDPRQTCDQITNLRNFEEPESPKPPLVLIDNEDEEKVFQLCSYINEKARREARDCRGKQKTFCVLVICIRMTVFPKKKEEGMRLSHELQPEEAQWFRSKYEALEERYKKKQLGLHPRLLISFNIIKENFNPDYIKRTVEEFVTEVKDFNEKRLLKFVALVNSFDPDFQSIPVSCFNPIMCPAKQGPRHKPWLGQKRFMSGNVLWEASLSPALNVLLNRTPKQCMGGDIKAIRIISNNLSREILNSMCRQEEQTVSDVITEFLYTDIFLRRNEFGVQAQLIKIMKDILKKRAPFKKGRAKFSPIILEIGRFEGYDQAAEVLKVGFDKFDDPMIAQQIARIYIHCSNWKAADEFARVAQDMKPRNSYLCDTYGQVYKEQLIGRWKECFESEEQLEEEKAMEMIDIAFKAIDIFRREQRLSDDDCTTAYNNCGFFSELRVIVTLLDCCRFLKAFKIDKGEMLHKFLIDAEYIPDGLREEIGDDRIKLLKKLCHEYEKPMRRLEDELIQLKEDSCYQYSPGYASSIRNSRMFVHLQECLDTYFGEDNDLVPHGLSEEQACEYRRRRVKRKGGNSLSSIYELRNDENAVEEFWAMHSILEKNVQSRFCSTFDLKTILNVTVARMSKGKRCAQEITLETVLDWTHQLYDKSKQDALPYLEAYLYAVMFNWPTEWRRHQGFGMFPCMKIKDIIKEWKEAFEMVHPAQREEEGKKPDRRKGTTLFFLGQGEGFDEIVFYSELQGFSRRLIGDSIWDTTVALERLKRLKGTLQHGGCEISVTLISQKGSATQLIVPTSYPIKDHSLWQKSVRFVLGFCWSGPRAYSVTRDSSKMNLESAHTPVNFSAVSSKRYDNSQQKLLSEQAVEQFWKKYFDSQWKLEKVEKDLRLCTHQKQKKVLEQRKRDLEKEKETMLQKRTSVLQGPD
ncbi:sterile alpha motif domain-containing protein 9-like [Babylonia areolata]|uniref:sterile alpha motif domain-containing protein 9-like n=1 Tax=Babylonia areolata TaxID=304850 RepID=UPI003FD6BA43